jgi:hypothetical protein
MPPTGNLSNSKISPASTICYSAARLEPRVSAERHVFIVTTHDHQRVLVEIGDQPYGAHFGAKACEKAKSDLLGAMVAIEHGDFQ